MERIGHYTIVGEIGRGGMGVVYKAYEDSLARYVAIKVLGEHLSRDEAYVKRFLREARAAAALSHPNIVQIYTVGEEKGKHYFVMEYVDGASVQDLIRQKGKLSEEEACNIILQAAKGLAAAHDRGIIHRDIKPGNLLVTKDGSVKIADFGLALRPTDQTRLTATGFLVGTPGYLAPEQCTDGSVDRRTDIYALGVTFYEMLTGRLPFAANSPAAVIRKIMEGEAPELTSLNPSISPEVAAIVSKMMARDPNERYQSCYQLAADIKKVLDAKKGYQDAVPPLPMPSGERTVPMVEQGKGTKRWLLAALLLLALAAAAAAGYILMGGGQQRGEGGGALTQVVAEGQAPVAAVPAQESEASSEAKGKVREKVEAAEQEQQAASSSSTTAAESSTSSSSGAVPTVVADADGSSLAVSGDGGSQGEVGGPRESSAKGSFGERPVSSSAGGRGRIVPGPHSGHRRPAGVLLIREGDPLLGNVVVDALGSALRGSGFPVRYPHNFPEIAEALEARRKGRVMDMAARRVRWLAVVKVEVVGERELEYLGRSQTAWTSDVTIVVLNPRTGDVVVGPCGGRVEYTTVETKRAAAKVLSRCVKRVAKDLVKLRTQATAAPK